MILYLGNYLDEMIIQLRGIPSRNAAGSNRIFRIAHSLIINSESVEIISPGISLRSKPKSLKVCHSRESILNNVKIFYSKTSSIPIINLISSTYSILKRLYSYLIKNKIKAVIIYNFNLELLIIVVFLKILSKTKIINHIEDISIPKFVDWKPSTEVRPVQQLFFYFCMKSIARMSNGYIIPTKKFLAYLPMKNKPVVLVTGCNNIDGTPEFNRSNPIKILFSGKIEFEHGIELLINTAKKISTEVSRDIKMVICGTGEKEIWLKNELLNNDLSFISYLGFVSDKEYNKLLKEADICLVLQNPEGRYSNLKTPSKFYEYYSNGKCVIATNVGDYDELPEGSFIVCEQFTEDRLLTILENLIADSNRITEIKKRAYEFALNEFRFDKVGKRILNVLEIR